ncbi:alpha/beta hydrolase [Hyphobacterium sp. CCMP332]|nr:alpha/beta hydrolase [Hyphobacterium sp. CCMP332]
MNRLIVLFFVLIFSQAMVIGQEKKSSSGNFDIYQNFETNLISPRTVRVWKPKDYSPEKKYAVLYMHDAQNIFGFLDTWNGQNWNAEGTAEKLIEEGKTRDFIIVGIDNGGIYRRTDYMPQKVFDKIPKDYQEYIYAIKEENAESKFNGDVRSDNYLKFLVSELKPFIDKKYATYTDRENTFIAGSSFGGLISIYAISEYPETFGGAACLSTHWTVTYDLKDNPVPALFADYLLENLPDPQIHKIYFDFGTETLDSLYEPCQLEIDKVMEQKGYTSDNWLTKKFPGDKHDENSWSKRFYIPLEFLLAE